MKLRDFERAVEPNPRTALIEAAIRERRADKHRDVDVAANSRDQGVGIEDLKDAGDLLAGGLGGDHRGSGRGGTTTG